MTRQRIQGGLHGGEGAESIHAWLRPIAGHVVVDQGPCIGFGVSMGRIVLGQVDHSPQRAGNRHGVFDVQGEPTPAMIILSWLPDVAESINSDNLLYQVWSVDMIVGRGQGRGLRVVANYTEVGPVESDSDLVQVLGVNRILDFAEHLNTICSGARELPAEP